MLYEVIYILLGEKGEQRFEADNIGDALKKADLWLNNNCRIVKVEEM